jgi:hypothetical protein
LPYSATSARVIASNVGADLVLLASLMQTEPLPPRFGFPSTTLTVVPIAKDSVPPPSRDLQARFATDPTT